MPRIELLPAVQELDARIKGRLIYQTMRRLEVEQSGSFIWAGWIISYDLDDNLLRIGLQEFA